MRAIYIHSCGRSGSNRLLDFFDVHSDTLCRSEVQEIGGDFRQLARPVFEKDLPGDFSQLWLQAVAGSRSRNSFRDRFTETQKIFFRQGLARFGQKAMAKQKLRALSWFHSGDEWEIPPLWYRTDQRDRVVPVLKILSQPQWALRLHKEVSDLVFLHNIRRPDAYLASWWNRYVNVKSPDNPEKVFTESMALVSEILDFFQQQDRSHLASFSLEALIEAEMWLWRYQNELPFTHLGSSPRYELFWYEDISRAPAEEARRAFLHAGLQLTDSQAEKISTKTNTLFSKPHNRTLDTSMVRSIIETVLKDSPLWAVVEPRLSA